MAGKRARPKVRLNPYAVWRRLDRANLSQNELARRMGISSGYLSQLITGQRCPSPRMRRRLQRALDIARFDDLFIVDGGDAP